MSVNPTRVKQCTDVAYSSGSVVYQMCRDIRVHDNDALLFAQELATSKGSQLIVNYVIWNYEWQGATRRFYDWVIPSLQEVEKELHKYNIPLVITFETKKLFEDEKREKVPPHVGAVVIDELPLHFMRKWKNIFLSENKGTPLYEVDAHNCIPVWVTSQKQEFAAHTIRRKIHVLLQEYLDDYSAVTFHRANHALVKELKPVDWDLVKRSILCKENIKGVGVFVPGEYAAKNLLKEFIQTKLTSYDISRNEINSDGQSNMSPYIAHGNISRRRIILEVLKHTGLHIEEAFDAHKNGSNGTMGSVAAFIEECVVRAEIAENFCYYNDAYDSFEGFPLWAKETLHKASTDTRTHIYSLLEFETAITHDPLWNAAQMQMVLSGKMHGYMRMYWAKKILQWSSSPKEAMEIAVYLNDMYELDGRDPNGYVGCAWSIGGLHDRPWFGRPIFGSIRYMAESGVAKRGKVKEYIEKWTTKKLF